MSFVDFVPGARHKLSERNDSGEWKVFRKKLMRVFADALRLKKFDTVGDEAWESRYARIRDRLNNLCDRGSCDADVKRLCARLEKYSAGMFTFLFDENVDHTNNRRVPSIRKAG